jgi:outer membrane receptor for Fe3+-dicitrate
VERYQRGLGHFLTPYDLQRTVYRDTESLFHSIPGVRVVPLRNAFAIGDRVLMRGLMGGWCTPTVFIDGIRMEYDPQSGATLSLLAPIDWLGAVEVYRRTAEVPLQYGITTMGGCGVILFWTKR